MISLPVPGTSLATFAQGQDGDFSAFNRLIDATKDPYVNRPEFAEFEEAPTPSEIVCQTSCGT